MKAASRAREVRRTLLIVGEGSAEQVFLSHLKRLYVTRGAKTVTIKNAQGKGGAHVLDHALRQWRQADYDDVAVLLDTDTNWGERERALARRKRVQVFACTPCLEALLLRVRAHAVPPGGSPRVKRAFSKQFGTEAHEAALYDSHFDRAALEAARARLPELNALLTLLAQ